MKWWRLCGVVAAVWGSGAAWAMNVSEVQLNWALPSGVYRCDYGEPLIGVERQQEPPEAVRIHYQGKVHLLTRQPSASGLPRYTNAQAGLLWIDLPWKGVLLNLRNERPIANDCTHAPELALAQLAKPTQVAAALRGSGKKTPAAQKESGNRKPARVAKAGEAAATR